MSISRVTYWKAKPLAELSREELIEAVEFLAKGHFQALERQNEREQAYLAQQQAFVQAFSSQPVNAGFYAQTNMGDQFSQGGAR